MDIAAPPAAAAANHNNENDNHGENDNQQNDGNNNNNNNNNPLQNQQVLAAVAQLVTFPILSPLSMVLTEAETGRALQVKRALQEQKQGSSDLPSQLSDFECAHYALGTDEEESMEQVLHRIRMMHAFRQEYRIHDTPEEGVALYEAFTRQHPGMFLALEYLEASGNFAAIDDIAQFKPLAQIRTPEQRRIFMGGVYYKFQAMSAHFQSIREGMSCVLECEGVGLANVNPTFNEQLMVEMYQCYPKKHKELLFVNSPSAINMLYALWKRFMNKNMEETFQLGCRVPGTLEGERLDKLYKLPTEEAARQNMIRKIQGFLQLRYHNQRTFELPETPQPTIIAQAPSLQLAAAFGVGGINSNLNGNGNTNSSPSAL